MVSSGDGKNDGWIREGNGRGRGGREWRSQKEMGGWRVGGVGSCWLSSVSHTEHLGLSPEG